MELITVINFVITFLSVSAYNQCKEKLVINHTKIDQGCAGKVCASLETALDYYHGRLNNLCMILENKEEILKKPHRLQAKHFGIFLSKNKVKISCEKNISAGITFYDSEYINLSGNVSTFLLFHGCGMNNRISIDDNEQLVTSSLMFDNVSDLKLSYLNFEQFVGYGILIKNGKNVNSEHLTLYKNDFLPATKFGGGMLLIFSANKEIHDSSKNTLPNLVFKTLYIHAMRAIANEKITQKNELLPFGNGGGVSIFFNQYSSNIFIKFDVITLKNNSALNGGSIYVVDVSERNSVEFKVRTISNSRAAINGGAVFYSSGKNSSFDAEKILLKLFSSYCYISNNTAKFTGGGICIQRNVMRVRKNKWFLVDCHLETNTAKAGSHIFAVKSYVNISSQIIPNVRKMSYGLIALYRSHLYVNSNITIAGSYISTAIIMDHSSIYINGTLILSKNHGVHGGGLAMYGLSKIFMVNDTNCKLIIEENHSDNQGSGIYAKSLSTSVGISTKYLERSVCIFQFLTKKGKIMSPHSFVGTAQFKNNIKNDIYVSNLLNCKYKDFDKPILNWPGFSFYSASVSHRNMITDPFLLKTERRHWENISPGIEHSIDVRLYDEFKMPVSGLVDVTIQSNNAVFLARKRYSVTNTSSNIVMNLKGQPNSKFNLSLTSSDNDLNYILFKNLTLGDCPFFTIYNNTNKSCICMSEEELNIIGRIKCHGGSTVLMEPLWTPEALPDYKHSPRYKSDIFHCPSGYCKKCKLSTECVYDPNNQCSENRMYNSRLCSKCKNRYSLSLAGDKCVLCQKTDSLINGLKAFSLCIVMFLWTGVVTLLIILLNKLKLTGFVVPFCYFYLFAYNLMDEISLQHDIERSHFWPFYIIDIIHHIYVLFPSCFLYGLNNLTHMLFTFWQSICWILSWRVIYLILESNKYFSREMFLRSVNAVTFLAYEEMFHFIFKIFLSTRINGKTYVLYYADIEYREFPHCIFLTLAWLALIYLFYFLLSLTFATTWSAAVLQNKRAKERNDDKLEKIWERLAKFLKDRSESKLFTFAVSKDFLVHFQYGLKKNEEVDRTWFSIVYIIFTAVFTGLSYGYFDVDTNSMVLTIAVLIFFLSYANVLPYTEKYTNYYELFVLGLLVLLGIFIDGNKGSFSELQDFEIVILRIIIWLPMVFMVLCLIFSIFWKCGCNNKYNQYIRNTTWDQYFPFPEAMSNMPLVERNIEEDEQIYRYSKSDLIPRIGWDISSTPNSNSKFEKRLIELWDKAITSGKVQYNSDDIQCKVIDGDVKFVAQLNTIRPPGIEVNLQTQSEGISMKLQQDSLENNDEIFVNVTPPTHRHFLLVPNVTSIGQPQGLNERGIELAVSMCLMSMRRDFKIEFTSQVNPGSGSAQQFHMFLVKEELPIDNTKVRLLGNSIYCLSDYYINGFVLQLIDDKVIQFAREVFKFVSWLRENEVAHNVFISRQKNLSSDNKTGYYVTVHIFPMKEVSFSLGRFESSGLLSMHDAEQYASLTEDKAIEFLKKYTLNDDDFKKLCNAFLK